MTGENELVRNFTKGKEPKKIRPVKVFHYL